MESSASPGTPAVPDIGDRGSLIRSQPSPAKVTWYNGSMRHSPSNATETIQEVRKDAYRTQPHRAADTVQA